MGVLASRPRRKNESLGQHNPTKAGSNKYDRSGLAAILPRLDSQQKTPGEFCGCHLNCVGSLEKIRWPIACKNTSLWELPREQIAEPVHPNAICFLRIPPCPSIRRLCVEAVNSDDVELSLDVFIDARVELSYFNARRYVSANWVILPWWLLFIG